MEGRKEGGMREGEGERRGRNIKGKNFGIHAQSIPLKTYLGARQ